MLVCRDSAKDGPIVGWIRTDTSFCLELLSFFPEQLGACPEEEPDEELCPLLLELPLLLLEEAICDLQTLSLGH